MKNNSPNIKSKSGRTNSLILTLNNYVRMYQKGEEVSMQLLDTNKILFIQRHHEEVWKHTCTENHQ